MNANRLTTHTHPMRMDPQIKPLTFGDFVAGAYRAWGERQAIGLIQLALKAHVIVFRRQQRFVFS
jgi:hypothetical protein